MAKKHESNAKPHKVVLHFKMLATQELERRHPELEANYNVYGKAHLLLQAGMDVLQSGEDHSHRHAYRQALRDFRAAAREYPGHGSTLENDIKGIIRDKGPQARGGFESVAQMIDVKRTLANKPGNDSDSLHGRDKPGRGR